MKKPKPAQPHRLTSRDIAELANVSQTTVSRVLRNDKRVHSDTREKVAAVIRAHNYHPSAAARSMKTSRTNTVGVVIARLSNPLYPYMLEILSGHLRHVGLQMTVWEATPPFEDTLLRSLGEGLVDGVIFTTATEQTRPLLTKIREQKPVVLVNRLVDDPAIDQFGSDNRAGGATVAQHFISRGRRHLALVTGPAEASTVRDRERGFVDSLAKANLPLPENRKTRVREFSYRCGYEAAQALLAMHPQTDALFCTNDVLAIGALDGLRSMGRRVPEDTWVIGYDDIPMAGWECVSLTTMRQPLDSMVHLAVERLVSRVRGEQPAEQAERVYLHNDLIVRRSSG